jgi:hypothetical protein
VLFFFWMKLQRVVVVIAGQSLVVVVIAGQ